MQDNILAVATDERETGGPAFPPVHDPKNHESGMTLRDWFAGQAMASMGMWQPPGDYLDSDGFDLQPHTRRYQTILQHLRAEWAYAQADAMLAARGQS